MLNGLPDVETITVTDADDDIVLVTLDRPDRLNAITSQMIVELDQVVTAVDLDPTVRVVIVTGAGRGFSAGLDLQSQGRAPGADGVHPTVGSFMWQDHLATLHERIHRSRKPWIAAVNGVAVGGGFAMALACDIRFASARATFGAVFLKIGVSNCDMGTSYFLPRLVGASRSAELLLTARIFDAAEALDMGLVLDVVEPVDSDVTVVDRALETARLIRAKRTVRHLDDQGDDVADPRRTVAASRTRHREPDADHVQRNRRHRRSTRCVRREATTRVARALISDRACR